MKLKYFAAMLAAACCLWSAACTEAAEHPMFDKVRERYRRNMTWQQLQEASLAKDAVFMAEKNGSIGLFDGKGRVLLPVEYDKITYLKDGCYLLKKDGLTGVCDDKGKIIVPVRYKRVRPLHDGIWLVRERDWGALTAEGKELLPCVYENIRPERGEFFVQQNGKDGVLAADGNVIWPCAYESIRPDGLDGYIVEENDSFRYYTADKKLRSCESFAAAGTFAEGMAAVKLRDAFGYMDEEGKIKLEPVFSRAAAFAGGRAFVVRDDRRFFIDSTGSEVCRAPEGKYIRGFEDGLAVFKKDGAFSFIDEQGQEQFSFKAAAFKKLDNGMYRITRTRHNVSLGGLLQSAFTMVAGIPTIPGVGKSVYDTVVKHGYTDSSGRMLISTRNDFNSEIIDGRVIALADDRPACYALDGSSLIPPVYDDFSELDLDSGDTVVVKAASGSGFYTLGKGEVRSGYRDAANFINKLAPVKVTLSRWTYVDRNFRQVMLNYWLEATPFYGHFAVVRNTGGRYCIIDRNGEVKTLLREDIDAAGPLQPDTAVVRAGGKWGVIDTQGRYVLKPEYDSVRRLGIF